ncbi:TetR/AcrR family transcriptional regulator [Spirillospora sp. NPDC029432]|uniref:TetR/AcrR family transcriptional regulator n=1 Tax=Spirillospora sp. NPDC029432 TaxID=3154599 RepID=UPI0034561773
MKSRRDRLREATVREITQTARRILVEEGPEAVTLRAIAREMGMTAPALYRYFGSHHELLRHVVGDVFADLTAALKAGLHAVPEGDMDGQFLAAARTFRQWAFAHRREYALLFGAPMPGLTDHREQADFAEENARRFGLTFLTLFLELWSKCPFEVPADEDIDPGLREQLRRYRELGLEGADLPLGVIQVFLQCWVRLQGAVSLEVFGHLDFALDDPEPMFELMLTELAPVLGLEYSPPAPPAGGGTGDGAGDGETR